ncbi:hypothetical protein BASA62_001185 [Batrachochytrium salamandrivorans]|nr:hypothetical protein BASA62_001185 [Batrachochytrium salamandrivorans]
MLLYGCPAQLHCWSHEGEIRSSNFTNPVHRQKVLLQSLFTLQHRGGISVSSEPYASSRPRPPVFTHLATAPQRLHFASILITLTTRLRVPASIRASTQHTATFHFHTMSAALIRPPASRSARRIHSSSALQRDLGRLVACRDITRCDVSADGRFLHTIGVRSGQQERVEHGGVHSGQIGRPPAFPCLSLDLTCTQVSKVMCVVTLVGLLGPVRPGRLPGSHPMNLLGESRLNLDTYHSSNAKQRVISKPDCLAY